MIKGYQQTYPLEPEKTGRFQVGPAFGAGFLAGAVLLLVPRGSPWSSITFFTPVIMGRSLPLSWGMPLLLVWLMHLVLALVYGVIVSAVAVNLVRERAILGGGVIGLVLYLLNFGVVSVFWPELRSGEAAVLFTHIVFGLIAAGAYRGLLKRKREAAGPTV